MRIRILESTIDGGPPRQFAASYLIDDCVAIDAGCIGFLSPVERQRRIGDVFLSHMHLDHIASLPLFLDNVYQHGPGCPRVYGSQFVLESLLSDVFNERLWPDLIRLSQEESPFINFQLLREHETIQVEHLRVTPVELNHLIPTFGFLVEDDKSTVAFVSDTAPTESIWELARNKPNLRGVFLESAFPNSMAWLAERAMHLTPDLLAEEYRKLNRDVPVIAVHIKPAFHDQVVAELHALRLAQLEIGNQAKHYTF